MDSFLKKYIQEDSGSKLPLIITTDKIIVALMTLKYSIFPWDISVTKTGNKLVFDKSDENLEKLTYIDMMTIDESPNVCAPEDERVILSLCEECTMVSANFQNFCIDKDSVLEDWATDH